MGTPPQPEESDCPLMSSCAQTLGEGLGGGRLLLSFPFSQHPHPSRSSAPMLFSAARSAAARGRLVCSSLCWARPRACGPVLSGLGGGTGRGGLAGASLGPENASWVQATDTGLGVFLQRQRDWLVTQLKPDTGLPTRPSPCKTPASIPAPTLMRAAGACGGLRLPGPPNIFPGWARGWAGGWGREGLELRGWEGCLGPGRGRAGRGRGGLAGVCEGWGGRAFGAGTTALRRPRSAVCSGPLSRHLGLQFNSV